MRADLAAALLHSPKILFLDEPTIGLDIVAKEKLRTFIKEINKKLKVTVLLTTHDMSDLEKLCDRMMIIDFGHAIYDGSVDDIRKKYGTNRILIIEFEEHIPDIDVPNAKLIKSEGKRKWYQFNRVTTSPSNLINFLGSKYSITDLTVDEPEIEEMVRNIYQGKYTTSEVF